MVPRSTCSRLQKKPFQMWKISETFTTCTCPCSTFTHEVSGKKMTFCVTYVIQHGFFFLTTRYMSFLHEFFKHLKYTKCILKKSVSFPDFFYEFIVHLEAYGECIWCTGHFQKLLKIWIKIYGIDTWSKAVWTEHLSIYVLIIFGNTNRITD